MATLRNWLKICYFVYALFTSCICVIHERESISDLEDLFIVGLEYGKKMKY